MYGRKAAVIEIRETLPIFKRKDEAALGEYRTKRVILEMCDEMQQSAVGVQQSKEMQPMPDTR